MQITNLALCTPLGLTAASTVRACAAGVSRVEMVDDRLPGVVACRLPRLAPHLHREERMLALARNCLRQIRIELSWASQRLACFLALPEAASGAPFDLDRWLAELQQSSEAEAFAFSASRSVLSGRAGLFTALQAASDYLEEHGGLVLVGAADCASDPYSLRVLADGQRLLGERNPDGLVPGEAAGMAVLAASRKPRGSQRKALGTFAALALADCASQSASPLTATALTEVFRKLRHQPSLVGERVDRVLSCQPETQFWGQEFSAAHLRNASLMPEPIDRRGLTRSLGDLGAAAPVVQLAMALDALHPLPWRPRRRLSRVLIYGSSDAGTPGACVVTP